MIKKISILMILLAAFLAVSSCSVSTDTDSDELAAQEIAESLGNPENGLAQELDDNATLYSETGVSLKGFLTGDTPATKATYTLTGVSGGLASRFGWDSTLQAYTNSASGLSVTGIRFSGTISSITARVQFFTNDNLTGDGVQLTVGNTLNSNTNIHSMYYYRAYAGTIQNNFRDISRTIAVETDLNISGINDGTDGTVVSGSRVEAVSVVSGSRTGNWTLTHTFSNVKVYREFIGGEMITTMEGTATVRFTGTWTGLQGSKTVDKTATVQFNRTRTVTVTVDGSTVTVDIVTGQQS